MVTIGADLHKRWHTVVAVDQAGRRLAERTVRATAEGHLDLLRWATSFPDRRWALEDCRPLSRRLERELVTAGERVVRVPPKLMAGARRSVREPGKSDPIDALAVARAAVREPDLPVARLDGPERELHLLVAHRDDLVAERTRAQNRLRGYLHELMPDQEPAPRTLGRSAVLDELGRRLGALEDSVVARLAIDLVAGIAGLTDRIAGLEQAIRDLVADLAPSLLSLQGCGPLTAARLVGHTAGIERFRSAAAYARHNGTAPVPVWSGNLVRHRLSRGGDRQIDTALHTIAITQLRLRGPGHAYVTRRMAAGDSRTEAIRALRRRISDEVYRRMRVDEVTRRTHLPEAA